MISKRIPHGHCDRRLIFSFYKNYYCISGILAVVHFGLFLFSRLLAANSEIKIRKIVSLSFVLDGFKTQSLSRKTEGNN